MQTITHPNVPAGSRPSAAKPSPSVQNNRRRIVDAPMMMFHWLFALSFTGAYLSAESEQFSALHKTLGYLMIGLLAFRIVYGFVGPNPARFSTLWRKVSGFPGWIRSLIVRDTPMSGLWRQGENLIMNLAVILILLIAIPVTISGYGAFNDWPEFFEEIHGVLGETMLIIVLSHLALMTVVSLLRKKNVASPMLTGHAQGRGADLVKSNRVWLAALILISALAYGAWEWQQAPNGLISTSSFSQQFDESHHDD